MKPAARHKAERKLEAKRFHQMRNHMLVIEGEMDEVLADASTSNNRRTKMEQGEEGCPKHMFNNRLLYPQQFGIHMPGRSQTLAVYDA